jgi:hypothetical protein
MAATNQVFAQEDEQTTVHITIKEDGKVTADTTFELKEGQDPDMVKKMVQHLAGGDVNMKKKEVIVMKKGDVDCDHKSLAWVYDKWHIKSETPGIDLDSIKEADDGGKVMVFKDEDVNVYVIKKGDKDVKVVKKIKVEVDKEPEEEVEKEVVVEVKKEKKKKEK